MLDEALAEVGVAREDLYVTNAVKHFKFQLRGKRRIHQTPTAAEAAACYPWLSDELRLVKPRLVVLMGATAAKRVLGPGFRLTRCHGEPVEAEAAEYVTATLHPSAVLRGGDRRSELLTQLVDDLGASFSLLAG